MNKRKSTIAKNKFKIRQKLIRAAHPTFPFFRWASCNLDPPLPQASSRNANLQLVPTAVAPTSTVEQRSDNKTK